MEKAPSVTGGALKNIPCAKLLAQTKLLSHPHKRKKNARPTHSIPHDRLRMSSDGSLIEINATVNQIMPSGMTK
jgi:hypothetical protein